MQSDISRLEAKIERMDAQLAAKDRELATLTRTVCTLYQHPFGFFTIIGILNYFQLFMLLKTTLNYQEAKNTAALKSQIDKLQQERDEFQKMVIGNQVRLPYFISLKITLACFFCYSSMFGDEVS